MPMPVRIFTHDPNANANDNMVRVLVEFMFWVRVRASVRASVRIKASSRFRVRVRLSARNES